MKIHANAPLGPKGRERTCSKWVARYRRHGSDGLLDRSSAPITIPHRTPEEFVAAIAALRRLRMTGAEIAMCLGSAFDRLGGLVTDRAGQALAARTARATQPLSAT